MESIVSKTVTSPLYSFVTIFIDGLTEQPGARDDSDYLAQDEEDNETLTSEGHDQATAEQQTDDLDPTTYAVDYFDEGESSNDAEPEQVQPVDDEESTVGLSSGDERTEQPVGVVEDNHEPGAAPVTDSDGGHPGPAEDLDTAAAHERSGDRHTPPLGDNSTGYEEAIATNEDYEPDYNETDQASEHEETIVTEGDARNADWATTAPETQHIQDDLQQHKGQDDAEETDKCEHVARAVSADDLTPPSTDSYIIDFTTPAPDDDHITGQQGKWLRSTITSLSSNLATDTDTDSIGQRTLDEFADAQEGTRGGSRPYEGVGSNNTTGECWFSTSFPPTLTQLPDQSNKLNPDLDQFGDEFNWDEDFGGEFDEEFDEFEAQNNVETKCVNSQEPASGKNSKRGFDEIDSDTADEEEAQGDVSPSTSFRTLSIFPELS